MNDHSADLQRRRREGAFRRLEKALQAEEGAAHADGRDLLVTLVEAHENRHHHFGPADSVLAIESRMAQED